MSTSHSKLPCSASLSTVDRDVLYSVARTCLVGQISVAVGMSGLATPLPLGLGRGRRNMKLQESGRKSYEKSMCLRGHPHPSPPQTYSRIMAFKDGNREEGFAVSSLRGCLLWSAIRGILLPYRVM